MKEMELDVNGKMIKVTIEEITYDTMNDILQRSTEGKMVGNVFDLKINPYKLQKELLIASVTLSEGKIGELPAKYGLKLAEIAMEENGLTDASFQ